MGGEVNPEIADGAATAADADADAHNSYNEDEDHDDKGIDEEEEVELFSTVTSGAVSHNNIDSRNDTLVISSHDPDQVVML